MAKATKKATAKKESKKVVEDQKTIDKNNKQVAGSPKKGTAASAISKQKQNF